MNHMAPKMKPFGSRLIAFPALERLFFRPFRGPLPGHVFWVILALPWSPFGFILVLLGSILVVLGTTLVSSGFLLAVEGHQNEHHRPPKTKSIKKRTPKKTKSIEKTSNKHTSMQTNTSRATRSLKMGRRNSRRDNNFVNKA